ncbi:MAG: leucyl-tRNA synthetase, partial [Candidatus Omnitrophota bacterium]
PAEQYAIQTGTHPRSTTLKNTDNFRKQIKRLGFSYDWNREINTTDPKYMRWTQWIFLKLYEKGLAYESVAPVWWCEELGCVLANEEVVNGKSERGSHPVVRRPMRQWMLKITAYADRLLEGLDDLDWPEAVKDMQRNWIGRSTGAEVDFVIESGLAKDKKLKVFTTRPDTLFGATYMVISPEHALIDELTTAGYKQAIKDYQFQAAQKSELERTELAKDKTGVFTGTYGINPVNGDKVPIWVADYVLATYGTGAIMAVPAHDSRDNEFALKYDLPIIQVVQNPKDSQSESKEVFCGEGININSDFLNGLETCESKPKIISWLEEKSFGKGCVNYKLRDWLFSRQRYWGEPIPVLHAEDGSIEVLKETDLPLELPEVEDYKPPRTGEPPLSKATDWVNYTDPNTQKKYIRETNTMPQWAGSCWYYLRYIDPHNDERIFDAELEKYWMNVDLYVGGAEHAVLHLLYSRFWHKVLYDLGIVSTQEPYQKLVNQGMILGEDGHKMSKSSGNVINPDDVIDEFGADSMRLFEMFMGPLEQSKAWSTNGVQGVYRFLGRIWKLVINESDQLQKSIADQEPTEAELRLMHTLIKKVTHDIDRMTFNTGISAFMIFMNEFSKLETKSKIVIETLVKLLSPFAPHMAEELWHRLGGEGLVCQTAWPVFEDKYTQSSEVEIAIQLNGKIRLKIMVAADLSKELLEQQVLEHAEIKTAIAGKSIRKVIVVPKRLVNIVAN